jgi:hypothetical protein
MADYHNNTLAITLDEWYDAGLTYDQYKNDRKRGQLRTLNRASYNSPVLIAYDSLKDSRKRTIEAILGDPHNLVNNNSFEKEIFPDHNAYNYYSVYQLEDGRILEDYTIREYCANAAILNAIGVIVIDRVAFRRVLGNIINKKQIWSNIAWSVEHLDKNKWPHSLPTNPRRLREKYNKYRSGGYDELIHKNFCNQNSRKVTDKLERLLMSIYVMDNLPFGTWVFDYYHQFIGGSLSIADQETGELFDREDFYNSDKGTYTEVSESTIWNILNKPENALIIDKMRNNRIDHITQKAPYNTRKKPTYSLSKITMDDRTLPRKTTDGKWVNAYYAMDVMSGAYIGWVHMLGSPGVDLVWDCFRHMYQNIIDNNLMWPGEVEVENHLMSVIREPLNNMFTFATFCPPGMSRAKRAEHLIRAKKYSDERRHQVGIGRWNGKGVYKVKSESKDEEYKQQRLPYDRLVADDIESINRYNNSLHPDQKQFPGKTRWQVLTENINPDLGRPIIHKLMKYIGHHTATSITNSNFIQVQYHKYSIDNFDLANKLKPNNYKVDAYYLYDTEGMINEIFLYQDGKYLGRASYTDAYNEAKIERTDKDEQIRTQQAKRQAKFFKREKELKLNKISKVSFMDDIKAAPECEIVPEPENELENFDFDAHDADYYSDRALDDL